MGELLPHQASRAYYERNHSGCLWGVLQFLDLHRHLQTRKMLADKRHSEGRNSLGTKTSTSTQKGPSSSEECLLDRGADVQMETKVNGAEKRSSKTHLLTFLYRKMTKKGDPRRKVSPSAARLLRTLSIHHLECDDYVLPDETISGNETLIVKPTPCETDLSASSEHVVLLPRDPEGTISDKQKEACRIINTKNYLDTDAEELGRNVMLQSRDKTKFLNADKELCVEVVQDPTPGIDSMDNDAVVNQLKDLKQRIKDVIKENRKEQHRISMDGVLDKVPLGHKLPEDMEKESPNLRDRDSPRSKFGSDGFICANSKIAHRGIQRSRSLTESLDQYAHLLSSISVREHNNLPGSSLLIKEEATRSAHKRILRSRSLTESLDRYSCLLESVSVREPKRFPEKLKSIQEDDLQDRKSPKTFGRMLSSPEFQSYPNLKIDENEVSHEALSLEEPAPSGHSVNDAEKEINCSREPIMVDTIVSAVESLEKLDKLIHNTVEPNASETKGGVEQLESVNECDQSETCVISDDTITEDSSHISLHEESSTTMDPIDKITKPSPVSVLGSDFEEDPVSPTNYTILEGADLQSSWIHFEELDSVANADNQLADGNSEGAELFQAGFDEIQVPRDTTELGSFSVQVDHKEEAEFNYVRDILSRSLFSEKAEELMGERYSPYQPFEPLSFVAGEGSPQQLQTTRDDFSEIDIDHQLMFDLISERLLEICQNSIACGVKHSRFGSHIRPMPVGNHLLEEVWAKISWHLSSHQHENHTMDYVIARDLMKDDGWMNLIRDTETVGIQLEGLILDDMLDEIILEI